MRCEIKNAQGAVDHECVCGRTTKDCDVLKGINREDPLAFDIIDVPIKDFEDDVKNDTVMYAPITLKKRGK